MMPGRKIPEDQRREQILAAAYRVAVKERLSGLSSRAVAAKAGVSNGLVFFYFRNRRELLLALLDWLLSKTILKKADSRNAAAGNASSRLADEIRNAVKALPKDRQAIELFFDYWFMGAHDEAIRKRIRAALKIYRNSYLPLARAVIAEQSVRYAHVSCESLADMAASFIEGCALRLVTERRHDGGDKYSDVIATLLSRDVE
jgi:TetR/AcrR family transcriptional regulator, transcriptional repressor of bet genes